MLLLAVSGVWAEKYTVALTSEYTSVPTIYAGAQNYFKLDVENTSGEAASNVKVSVFISGELIGEETISSIPAGEKVNLEFVDPTIRPVTENTVLGNNNENIVYNVVVSDGAVSDQKEFSFVILYNGNLGKEYAYPYTQPFMRSESFTGDAQIYKGDGYSINNDTSRDDAFAVTLDGGSVYKALLYVSYNWDKAPEGDFKSWTTTFNSQTISPIASYRDQLNLGKYGGYGYGLVVYDVTEAVVDGDNTFGLQKTAGNVAVYPSSLIVMTDNSSANPKTVYIAEEADLLSAQYNQHMDAIYNSSFENVAEGDATLYVFAANAQSGEGDLIINGNDYIDVWSGTSQSVEVYTTAVNPGDIAIQFKGTGSTILALQQMVVVEETASGISVVRGSSNTSGEYYDLTGRKLQGKPTQKGVYTLNGTKVLVK